MSNKLLLYDRFKDEAEFREKFVKPLLNRLGYYGVSEQHGMHEFGKDFVFSELHRLGGMRHYAAQVKHQKNIKQGKAVDALLSQVRQAFATPFTRGDSPRECQVSAVYVFNSGGITDGAKTFLLEALKSEHYGDNVHFLDGERLEALNEWGTLSSNANARTRLLGLRAALRFIIGVLKEYKEHGKPDYQPQFTQGIELYLSEPVINDDSFINELFLLWSGLHHIEAMRQILIKHPTDTVGLARNAPKLKKIARRLLEIVEGLCQKVDTALEKMKSLA